MAEVMNHQDISHIFVQTVPQGSEVGDAMKIEELVKMMKADGLLPFLPFQTKNGEVVLCHYFVPLRASCDSGKDVQLLLFRLRERALFGPEYEALEYTEQNSGEPKAFFSPEVTLSDQEEFEEAFWCLNGVFHFLHVNDDVSVMVKKTDGWDPHGDPDSLVRIPDGTAVWVPWDTFQTMAFHEP